MDDLEIKEEDLFDDASETDNLESAEPTIFVTIFRKHEVDECDPLQTEVSEFQFVNINNLIQKDDPIINVIPTESAVRASSLPTQKIVLKACSVLLDANEVSQYYCQQTNQYRINPAFSRKENKQIWMVPFKKEETEFQPELSTTTDSKQAQNFLLSPSHLSHSPRPHRDSASQSRRKSALTNRLYFGDSEPEFEDVQPDVDWHKRKRVRATPYDRKPTDLPSKLHESDRLISATPSTSVSASVNKRTSPGNTANVSTRFFRCSKCSKVFVSPFALNLHEEKHKFQCQLCHKNLKNLTALKDHISWSHSIPRTRICTFCAECFVNTSQLSVHVKNVHQLVDTTRERHGSNVNKSVHKTNIQHVGDTRKVVNSGISETQQTRLVYVNRSVPHAHKTNGKHNEVTHRIVTPGISECQKARLGNKSLHISNTKLLAETRKIINSSISKTQKAGLVNKSSHIHNSKLTAETRGIINSSSISETLKARNISHQVIAKSKNISASLNNIVRNDKLNENKEKYKLEVDKDNLNRCASCGKCFINKIKLQEHVASVHSTFTNVRKRTENLHVQTLDLQVDVEDFDGEINNEPIVDASSDDEPLQHSVDININNVVDKMSKQTEIKHGKCRICGIVTKHLEHHMYSKHGETKRKCPHCNEVLYGLYFTFVKHVSECSKDINNLQCMYCDKMYSSKSKLQVHLKKHIKNSSLANNTSDHDVTELTKERKLNPDGKCKETSEKDKNKSLKRKVTSKPTQGPLDEVLTALQKLNPGLRIEKKRKIDVAIKETDMTDSDDDFNNEMPFEDVSHQDTKIQTAGDDNKSLYSDDIHNICEKVINKFEAMIDTDLTGNNSDKSNRKDEGKQPGQMSDVNEGKTNRKDFIENKNIFKCKLCSKMFKSTKAIISHLERHKGRNEIQKPSIKNHEKTKMERNSITKQSSISCKYCNKICRSEKILSLHIKIAHNNKIKNFQEKSCVKNVTNSDDKKENIKKENQIVCHICDKKFNAGELVEHVLLHKKLKYHKCNICDKTFKLIFQLEAHKLKYHSLEVHNFKCCVCKFKFETENELQEHYVQEHTSENVLLCLTCFETFNCRRSSENHMLFSNCLETSTEHKHCCQLCKNNFETVTQLENHTSTTLDPSSNFCDYCCKFFISSEYLKNHKINCNANTLHCNFCEENIPHSTTLTKYPLNKLKHHISQRHLGGGTFVCTMCGKRFVYKRNLVAHCKSCRSIKDLKKSRHTKNVFKRKAGTPKTGACNGNENHVVHDKTKVKTLATCNVCNLNFLNADWLKIHEIKYHGDKTKDLNKQNYSYTMNHTENTKTNNKTGIKKLESSCYYCGQNFNVLNEFRDHVKVHESLKEYNCSICNLKFKFVYQVEEHLIKNHLLQASKFMCCECKTIFMDSVELKSHFLKQHQVNNTFTCYECNEIFDCKTSLENHIVKCYKSESHHIHECELCKQHFQTLELLQEHATSLKIVSTSQYHCENCSKYFYSQLYLDTHRTQCQAHALHCHFCEQNFVTTGKTRANVLDKLRRHISKQHLQGGEYVCTKCGKRYLEKCDLRLHCMESCFSVSKHVETNVTTKRGGDTSLKHHMKQSQRELKCSYCSKTFAGGSSYYVHMMEAHQEVLLRQCKYCEKQFANKRALRRHIDKLHTVIPECVDLTRHRCKKSFKYEKPFLKHKKLCGDIKTDASKFNIDNQELKTSCNTSKRGRPKLKNLKGRKETVVSFKDEHQVHNHMDLGENTKTDTSNERKESQELETCSVCDIKCKDLILHMKYKHSNKEKEKKCPHCSFYGGYTLRQMHMKECHRNEIVLQECPHCDEKFLLERGYSYHLLRTHGIAKEAVKAICPICGMLFNNIFMLNFHIGKFHDGEKVGVQCDLCQQYFPNKRDLTTHIERLHWKIRRFRCDLCKKKYASHYYLNVHKFRVHNVGFVKIPERNPRKVGNFECSECFYRYKEEKSLRTHFMREHMICTCDICKKSLRGTHTVERHLGYVHGIKHIAYHCKFCNFVGKTQALLKKHRRIKHKGMKIKTKKLKTIVG